MDFRCYVGKYEIKRFDELDKAQQEYNEAANMPHLVQVGPARLITPSPKALNYAVGLLLQTKMPKWWAANDRFESDNELARALHQQLIISEEEDEFDPEELSLLKRNVMLIARTIGMLIVGGADPQSNFDSDDERYVFYHEPLRAWIWLAGWLQRIFTLRERNKNFDLPIGPLYIFLSNRPGQPISMHVRPDSTLDALLYVAAGMITRGTVLQTCDKCDTPFLEGGDRTGKKRRGGARFCSDKCRYEYHNEVRRKARATKS
jgi:hypothetical protein